MGKYSIPIINKGRIGDHPAMLLDHYAIGETPIV